MSDTTPVPPEPRINLYDLTRSGLADRLTKRGAPRYAADQVFQWLYGKRVHDLDLMTDLSAELRADLAATASLERLERVAKRESRDGTVKFLWKDAQGLPFESVLIPMARDEEGQAGRHTACLSTQSGCRMRCAFCATGRPAFRGDLSPGSIVLQLLQMEEETSVTFSSVVVMGMGEPLDNYDRTQAAMRILNDPKGLDYGRRRITLSTCGPLEPLKRFIKDDWPVSLAVSFHSADPEVRATLMPMARSNPLEKLRKLMRNYTFVRRLPVTLEYILLKGVNDRASDAEKMAAFCNGLLCKVNLIRYNPVPELPYEAPSETEVLAFQNLLKSKRMRKVFLRERKGEDIAAACGQLCAPAEDGKNP